MKFNKRIAGAMVGVGLLVGMLGSSGVVLADQPTPGPGDQDTVQEEVQVGNQADDVLETASAEDALEAGDLDTVEEDVQVEDGSQADDDSDISTKSADQDDVQEEVQVGSQADDALETQGAEDAVGE